MKTTVLKSLFNKVAALKVYLVSLPFLLKSHKLLVRFESLITVFTQKHEKCTMYIGYDVSTLYPDFFVLLFHFHQF